MLFSFVFFCCAIVCFFFFQAEDGIRDWSVTGVQTCALPIWRRTARTPRNCSRPTRQRRRWNPMRFDSDKELNTYRNLIEPPTSFEDGFGWKTVLGALFLGLFVTPGSIYVMLVAGEAVGPAARWVTIFLFSELARRSLKELRQQEVFVLYYMTGHVLITNSGILWNLYMAQSEAFLAMGITPLIPTWVVPPADIIEQTGRTLFTREWLPAIGLIALTMLISRIDHYGLGDFLYRLTPDAE